MKSYTENHILSVSYDFLTCYCEKRDLFATLEKIFLRPGSNKEEFYKAHSGTLELFDRMKKDAQHDFAELENDIQYYFGAPDKDNKYECVSGLLTGHTSVAAIEETSIDQHIKAIKNLSESEYFKLANNYLDYYNNTVIKEYTSETTANSITDLIRKILQMEISSDIKYKLQDLLLQREMHLDKIHKILSASATFVLKYKKELDIIYDNFLSYWNEKRKDMTLKELIESHFQILPAMGEGVYDYVIRPCLFPVVISLTTLDESEKNKSFSAKVPTLSVGIFFGEYLPPNGIVEGFSDNKEQAIEALKLIADASRYEILKYLADKKTYAAEIATHLGLTPATVSHHMGNLYSSGIVDAIKENKKLYYQLNKDVLANYIDYFENMLLPTDTQSHK